MPLTELALAMKQAAHRLHVAATLDQPVSVFALEALVAQVDRMLVLCCRAEGWPLPLEAPVPGEDGKVVSLLDRFMERRS